MATSAVARGAVFALRREIARIEGTLPERLELPAHESGQDGLVLRRGGAAEAAENLLPTGAEGLDTALGGGLPFAALVEIHSRQSRDAGAMAGFTLALAALVQKRAAGGPLLWVGAGEAFSEAGAPYMPGILNRFGIAPEAMMFTRTRRLEDALWVAEAAASLTTLSVVLLEVRGASRRLDLTATRRLHHRTQAARRPLFLMRQAGAPEPTAAPVRLIVSAAASGGRETLAGRLAGSIGPPAFRVETSRSRTGIPATFMLEWNAYERAFHERRTLPDEAQDHGAVVSVSADGAHPAGQAGAVLARGAA